MIGSTFVSTEFMILFNRTTRSSTTAKPSINTWEGFQRLRRADNKDSRLWNLAYFKYYWSIYSHLNSHPIYNTFKRWTVELNNHGEWPPPLNAQEKAKLDTKGILKTPDNLSILFYPFLFIFKFCILVHRIWWLWYDITVLPIQKFNVVFSIVDQTIEDIASTKPMKKKKLSGKVESFISWRSTLKL